MLQPGKCLFLSWRIRVMSNDRRLKLGESEIGGETSTTALLSSFTAWRTSHERASIYTGNTEVAILRLAYLSA